MQLCNGWRIPCTKIAVILLTSASLISCSPHPDESLERARREGLRIGYAVERPYAYLDGDLVTGESAEIAKLVCRRLKIEKIEWVQMPFDSLIQALADGRCDAIAAGLFITPERQRRIAFSLPTYRARPGLLVARGNPRGLGGTDDLLHRPELKVAVLSGSFEEAWFRQQRIRADSLLVVSDAETGRSAVVSGAADALALSLLSLRNMAGQSGTLATQVLADPPGAGIPEGSAAMAFRLDDRNLLVAWNKILRSFIGTQEHLKLAGRFGIGAEDIPCPQVKTK